MALTAGIRYGGNCNLLDRRNGNIQTTSNQSPRSCLLMIRSNGSDSSRCRRARTISAVMTTERNAPVAPLIRLDSREIESGDGGGTEAVVYEKLDEWMRESVVDIVKNLRKAPLMVHVYRGEENGGKSDGASTRMVMEKAVAEEDWEAVRGKWEAGEAPLPEGLIFVEELEERHQEEENDDDSDVIGEADGVTRAWGVVIQGKGAECPPACYLLKTSTAMAGLGCGFGLGCTHFCMVRVNGFWETAESQLKNCWLLQAQARN